MRVLRANERTNERTAKYSQMAVTGSISTFNGNKKVRERTNEWVSLCSLFSSLSNHSSWSRYTALPFFMFLFSSPFSQSSKSEREICDVNEYRAWTTTKPKRTKSWRRERERAREGNGSKIQLATKVYSISSLLIAFFFQHATHTVLPLILPLFLHIFCVHVSAVPFFFVRSFCFFFSCVRRVCVCVFFSFIFSQYSDSLLYMGP